MQASINSIVFRNTLYKDVKLRNIITIKQIYRLGQFCDVKFVRIDEEDEVHQLSGQIKEMKYALKTISKSKIRAKSDNYDRQYFSIYNQIFSLYLMNHPNIVSIFWHFQDQSNIYILTEYGGTKLTNYSRKHLLTEDQIRDIFKQICGGVFQFHSKNIMHRDLSLDNIVISSQSYQVKLIDFGFANQFTGGRSTALGTLQIMAPQVYHQKKYNSKADIWSLGIILYQLFHKRNPFTQQNQEYTQQLFSYRRDKLQFKIDQAIMSKEAKQLIQGMLSFSPQKRPSVQKILKSKWLTLKQRQDELCQLHERKSDDNRTTKQIAANIKQKRSLPQFSQNQKIDINLEMKNPFRKTQRDTDKDDDFFFDKIIKKMTLSNSVEELQNRLKQLLFIRAQQINKKKKSTLQLLALQKKVIQSHLKNLSS